MIEIDKFIDRQLAAWRLAHDNYEALANVESKSVGWARVQFNPARIASTGAKVDATTIKKRACFLCEKNRPLQQESIEWGDYQVLVNPYPIFPRHLTIPAKSHTDQRILGRIGDMCRLAADLLGFVVFYNGPKCGASAPDHMHFQAGNADFLPLLVIVDDLEIKDNEVTVPMAMPAGTPGIIVIKSPDSQFIESKFEQIYKKLDNCLDSEPMMNLLCQKLPTGEFRLVILPRKKHRPSFYGDGEGQMLLSPASVDLAGVFITPVKRDFESIDVDTLQKTVDELCLSPQEIATLLASPMKRELRVGILSDKNIEISLNDDYLLDGDKITGAVSLSARHVKSPLLFEPCSPNCWTEVHDVTIGVNFHWQRKENQRFRGKIEILPKDGELTLINILPVEDYLCSVISSEMSATSQIELLKAHAVISRSWVLAQIQHDKKESQWQCIETESKRERWYGHDDHDVFDVCADDHCQRYQGITRQTTPLVEEAVGATAGEVLISNGQLCDARFSKCCGGVFEEFESCWEPEHKDYLVARRDSPDSMDFPDLHNEENARAWILSAPQAFCNTADKQVLSQVLNGYDQETADFYRWTVEYDADTLSQLVARRSGIDFGRILALEPIERGTSGRIITLRIVGEKRTMEIGKELEIRRILSESHLYSSAFVVEKRGDGGFKLYGAGWGHGVGLCQIGAAMMAHEGYDYRQILQHYYPGTTIEKI